MDTSFLVSLYSLDANSTMAAKTMQAGAATFLITTFGELELVNALWLRVFRKEASLLQAKSSLVVFERDLQNGLFQIKPLLENAWARARQLSRQTTSRLGTRTGDLLHVAAALESGSDWFYSFDRQQRKLAQTVKLKLNAVS